MSEADELHGQEGHDILQGDAHGDTLWGGRGDDVLEGDDGADTLVPGAGVDAVYGGLGDDTIVILAACELAWGALLSGGDGRERAEPARFDERPGLAPHEHPPVASRASAPAPLDRQRERLQATATRLAARREEARAASAPEAAVRALDAHLVRVEQRLAALDVDVSTRAVAPGSAASRAASSTGASP